MTDHTPISKVSRLDVISTGARRRWTLEEKQRIVAESYSAPRLASVTARRNGLSASQLFTWRRLAREGRLVEGEEATTFAPAIISPETLSTGLNRVFGAACGPRKVAVVHGCDCLGRTDRDCPAVRASRYRRQWHRCRGTGTCPGRAGAAMITLPNGVRVWLATGHTDMRKGFASLALQVQEVLRRDPLCGHLFCFRGRRGDLLKVIWHDGQGACLFTKRLERGRFLWPSPADGVVTISSAQLGYLLSGIDWRHPQETWRPTSIG